MRIMIILLTEAQYTWY